MKNRPLLWAVLILLLPIIITGCELLTKQYTLQVATNGQGSVYPAAGTYNAGESVTIVAVPAANWEFHQWSGDATGTQTTTSVVMNSNKTVLATFKEKAVVTQYPVNITVQGQGQVQETLLPKMKTLYNQGEQVKLEAKPAEGWQFKEWQGDLTGTTNPAAINVVKVYNITAVFEQKSVVTGAKWNFLVYLDADNNLEPQGIQDINEMEVIGSTTDVNIFVLLDRSPEYDTSNGNWAGTRLYKVTKDAANTSTITSQLIQDYGELDMSNPQTLVDFITYCQTNYPAERTVLTLWDHGNGVYPKMAKPVGGKSSKPQPSHETDPLIPQGICWDDTTGSNAWDCLTTDEVAWALKTARTVTGKKVDVLNMDACLMQMLEVAYEWRAETDYLVGSEETVPGTGNEYSSVISLLTTNPAITPRDFAVGLVDKFYQFYTTNGSGKETYSALSLGSEFQTLINSFKTFATAMKNTNDMASAQQAWEGTLYFTQYENNDMISYINNLVNLTTDQTAKTAALALKQAIGGAVISHKETSTYNGHAFGLAITLPSGNEWPHYSSPTQYPSLCLAEDTDWDEFIVNFVNYTGSGSGTNPQKFSFSLQWPSGDCDLGVREPNDTVNYWVTDGQSPNGVFSEDVTNGGIEQWAIKATYTAGSYIPLIYSSNYTGTVAITVTYNSQPQTFTGNVTAGEAYMLNTYYVGSGTNSQNTQRVFELVPISIESRP